MTQREAIYFISVVTAFIGGMIFFRYFGVCV